MVRKSKKVAISTELYQTEDENVRCTKLPEFIRAKKYLGAPFCVYFADMPELENVKCTILAGNYKNPNAELKNNECIVKNGLAEYHDLRFLGKSGRGTKFNVYIQLDTNPVRVITYHNAIKVTVDGPRPPRQIKQKLNTSMTSNEDLTPLKRKLDSDEYTHANESPLSSPLTLSCQTSPPTAERAKLLSQPLKKRFIQTYFMEEELYSNGCSSNSSDTSFNSSPAISPNPVSPGSLHHSSASSVSSNKSFSSCCQSFETMNIFQSSNIARQQENIYTDIINKYLNIFMNMYQIKITDELTEYLVSLILSKTLSGTPTDKIKIDHLNSNSILNNINLNDMLGDEQFLANFQLFYKNLVQNFGKTNIKSNCSSF